MKGLLLLGSRAPSPQAFVPLLRHHQPRPLGGLHAGSTRGAADMAISYLSAEEVKAILEGPPEELAKTAILDVRDEEEVAEGSIRGSTNIASYQFMDDRGVDAALESLAGKDRIIVHCALSQQRGPKCARRIQERLNAKAGRGSVPKVEVLERGFNGFYQAYGNVPTLVIRADKV